MNRGPSADREKWLACFRMPSIQTMVSRKSSITNAFVNSIIPQVAPSAEEIEEALRILEMDPDSLACSYCGDAMTEWDHLRPLVLNRRPTGFISEIENLVPACGKCNQSKGNKQWRGWITSQAPRSPTGRGVKDVALKIERIEAYERWREPTRIDVVTVIGQKAWDRYWSLLDHVIEELQACQKEANGIRDRVVESRGCFKTHKT